MLVVHNESKKSKKKIVPLVVVSEGKVTSGKRTSLINPIAFQGFNMKPRDFWEGICAVLRRKYDMDRIKSITMHSDAGGWIMSAKDILPNAEFVMDEFHIEKHFKQICAGYVGKAYANKLMFAIESGDYGIFCNVTDGMLRDVPNYEKTLPAIHKRNI